MGLSIREVQPGDLAPRQGQDLDSIFFEASGRTFASEHDQVDFHERWLGRYLKGGTDVVIVAQDGPALLGYLVGALTDPAEQPRFSDLSYFNGEFRDLCDAYPAHLHMNVAATARGRGIGALLIEAFALRAEGAGAPGMHVVTGRDARNVSFYTRSGFTILRTAFWNGRQIAFLGRPLAPRP